MLTLASLPKERFKSNLKFVFDKSFLNRHTGDTSRPGGRKPLPVYRGTHRHDGTARRIISIRPLLHRIRMIRITSSGQYDREAGMSCPAMPLSSPIKKFRAGLSALRRLRTASGVHGLPSATTRVPAKQDRHPRPPTNRLAVAAEHQPVQVDLATAGQTFQNPLTARCLTVRK